jgi:hypothetical protein
MAPVNQSNEPDVESQGQIEGRHRRFARRPLGTLAAMLAISAFMLGDVAGAGGDVIPITITNDNAGAISVTVYDENLTPRAAILSSQSISGFASIPISVGADASGYGHISWTATTDGNFDHRCGHRDKPGLRNGSVVHVRADSNCVPAATQ